ncbi:phiSA1p31-related protein [Streptomyces anulatus]
MNTYLHDNIIFDLTRSFVDVLGVEWEWHGQWTPAGEPLLVSPGLPESPVPLPDVYRDHGPLIPISRRPSAAQYRAAVDPDYAATVAAGYVENHIVAAVAPALTAHHLPAAPLHYGWRAFLTTIKGERRD